MIIIGCCCCAVAADLDESSISAANSSTDLLSPLTEAAVDEVVVTFSDVTDLNDCNLLNRGDTSNRGVGEIIYRHRDD